MKRATVTALRPGTANPGENTVPAAEVTARTGLSYTRLDFLCRAGRLHPVPGSRPALRFTQDEARIAEVMAGLIGRGLTGEAAATYARQHVEQGRVVELLDRGLLVIGMETGG